MTQVEAKQPAQSAQRDPAKIFPVSWDQFHRDFAGAGLATKRRRPV